MSTTWTFAQLVDLLKTQLDANAAILALTPVPEIRVSVPHADESISDVVVFGIDVTDIKEQRLMGGHLHDEDNTVGCMAAVIRYGSGDTDAKEARDRVLLLLDIVDEHLRETDIVLGQQALRGPTLTNRVFESFPSLVGQDQPVRVARVTFDLEYTARTTP